MKVKIKSVKTGEIKEKSKAAWELMQIDGRSRHYTLVSEEKEKEKPTRTYGKKKAEPEPMVIEKVFEKEEEKQEEKPETKPKRVNKPKAEQSDEKTN